MTKDNTVKRLVLFDIDGTLLHPTVWAQGNPSGDAGGFWYGGRIDSHQFAGKSDWHTLTELLSGHGYTREAIGQQMEVYDAAIERHIERFIPLIRCAPDPAR